MTLSSLSINLSLSPLPLLPSTTIITSTCSSSSSATTCSPRCSFVSVALSSHNQRLPISFIRKKTNFFYKGEIRRRETVSASGSNDMTIPEARVDDESEIEAPLLDPESLSKPRRIALFVEPSPFAYVSGYKNRFQNFIRYLREMGDEVIVVTTHEGVPEEFYGAKVIGSRSFPCPYYQKVPLSLALSPRIISEIARFKPDIIHASSPGIMVFGALAIAKMLSVPIVMSYHTHVPVYIPRYTFSWLVKPMWSIIRFLHRAADLTLVPSAAIGKDLIAAGATAANQLRLWNKGVDSESFNPRFRSQEMRIRLRKLRGAELEAEEGRRRRVVFSVIKVEFFVRLIESTKEAMSDAFCSDCKRHTEVVFDHSAGDTVCSECGLVLESHSIDETSEWRTFANESGDNDPVRVGGPTNPLLADGGLTTVISKPNGSSGDFLSSSLGRWQNRGSNPDRGLIVAFKTIATMADRLGLVATIKDRANEIYKRVEDQKSSRGRNQDALLAACLYIACRQEDKPRTVKEICSVANGATKKEIGRAKEYIVKQLGLETGQSVEMGTIHAGDFMRRFCSNLGMSNQTVKAAQESVQKSEEFDIRRSPISIAAAVIYIITQLSDDKKLLRDISVATGVAEGTIRNSYKDLYPHLSRIIPAWYAKEEDLKNLQSP